MYSWTGDKALRELEEANISKQCFPILLECATKAIKIATDLETEAPHLSGMSVITLEGLFSSLTYFFSRNGSHMLDYQLALQRRVRKDDRRAFGNWTHTLSLWCLNPAVVFRDVADLSLSVILTSGTLSPMTSFSSELGVQFETSLEAPHVIDVDSQVWPAMISTGPGNYPLNASFKTADGYAFQDEVGRSLEEIFKIVPGGCLVFFPSYKLMEKLCNRWSETEPRGGNQDDFELVLKGYYDSIHNGKRPALGRKKGLKKMISITSMKLIPYRILRKEELLCLVFVEERYDIQVALKKKYNDTYKSSKNLLSGSEWYCHQAFRALNQAAGRCIRHRLDYGAIILLDERFREERNRAFISKWLRRPLRVYDSFNLSLEGLRSFFEDAKERYGMNKVHVNQNLGLNGDGVQNKEQNMRFTRKKNQKLNKSGDGGEKETSVIEDNISIPLGSLDLTRSQPFAQSNSNTYNFEDHINPQCCDLTTRFTGEPSVAITHEEISIVKETPCLDISGDAGSPNYSKDDNSDSTIIEASAQFPPDHISSFPMSLTNGHKNSSRVQSSITGTPEKNITANNILEMESSLNLSVNSHNQKRRKPMVTSFINLIEEENHITPCDSTLTWNAKSSVDVRKATHGSEYGFGRILKSHSPQLPTSNLPGSCSSTVPLLDKSNTDNLLGVQIMATNSSNVQLLDKILFYIDSLEVKNHEETEESASKEVDMSPVIDAGMGEVAVISSIDKYSYLPQLGKSEVWKTRKSKPRLRGLP
ncbi:ATP-dependent helicase, C-terminal [Sesbania bispinosa]|nr:ATP-dependent helicase, C-terminal [Sesbania bispinosa]